MRRTNIYLDDDQILALKHLAIEERESLAVLVRRAVDAYLAQRFRDQHDWGERFDALVERIQRRIPRVAPEQIEADITAAREDVRDAHRAARETSRARGR